MKSGKNVALFFVRQFQFQRELVAVRDAHAQEGVCDDDLGLGADALAAGGRIFGAVFCDGLALEGDGEPALCIFAVGKSRGCHELSAAIGQIRVRVVGRLRVVFVDEVVDEFQLPLQQGKQCGVVVLLGEPCRKGFFAAGNILAVRLFGVCYVVVPGLVPADCCAESPRRGFCHARAQADDCVEDFFGLRLHVLLQVIGMDELQVVHVDIGLTI